MLPRLVYALQPVAVVHLEPFPAALTWMLSRITFRVPRALQRAFARSQRVRSGMSVFSGVSRRASRPSEVRTVTMRPAMMRLYLYSRKLPSGLRLPGVSIPWPLSRRIVIVLQFWCSSQIPMQR